MKDVRAHFPGAQHQVYLNVAVRGLIPDTVMEVASRHLDGRLRGTDDKAAYQDSVERARGLMAAMILLRLAFSGMSARTCFLRASASAE